MHSPTTDNAISHSSAQTLLAAIIAGAQAILEQDTFADAAREIFDRSRQMTGARAGYVALLREDGQENEVLFLEAGGMPCTVDPELPMPIRGLRAIAYETHQAVYDNHFMEGEWATFMPEGHVHLQNVLFAPLNLDGRTVGIMGLANKPTDFTDADAEMATVFGELAAIALAKSRHLDILHEKNRILEQALSEIKTLRGLLPMCSHCKSIRNDSGLWTRIEGYLSEHTDATFTHGMCPNCLRELYPEDADEIIRQLDLPEKA